MNKNNFYDQEELCRARFCEAAPCWHMCTPEDFPILFNSEDDYEGAMEIVAVCALLHSEIKIYTFDIMSNHLHFVVNGQKSDVEAFFYEIRRCLSYVLKDINLPQWECKLFCIDSLEYFRAAVAYCNRNAYVINPLFTPFNYRWGASSLFFSYELKEYYKNGRKNISVRRRREILHSKRADGIDGPYTVDGHVSPLSFCFIEEAEKMFRDARHYFICITKDVESQKFIANEIGEGIFYTDDELFSVVVSECRKMYGGKKPFELSAEEKICVAMMMRKDYNSNNKQICRILRLDVDIVNKLFPLRAKR